MHNLTLLVFVALLGIAVCDLGNSRGHSLPADFNITAFLGTNGDNGPELPGIQLAAWPDGSAGPASDDLWNLCKCKGTKFLTQMSYSNLDVGQSLPIPQNTAQSPWSFANLSPWGYYYAPAEEDYCDLDSMTWGIAPFFKKVGISDRCVEQGSQWRARTITHFNPAPNPPVEKQDQIYVDPNGQIRKMTGAYFVMAVNPQGGIIAQNLRGPRTAADRLYGNGEMPDTELPALGKVSDMMWTIWEHEIPEDKRKGLQFYVVLYVINDTTLQILKRALQSVQGDLPAKGVKFDITSDAGRAILGTPNAVGFAHFLIQHKAQLGLKTTKDVFVFQCETIHGMPCLLFSVKNLDKAIPRPTPKKDPDSHPDPSQDPNARIPQSGFVAMKRSDPRKQKRNLMRTHVLNQM